MVPHLEFVRPQAILRNVRKTASTVEVFAVVETTWIAYNIEKKKKEKAQNTGFLSNASAVEKEPARST